MLRLSKLADYATVLLVQLGQVENLATASSLAQSTGVPEPTVAKLLKGLAGDGFVISYRGARGGYRLGRPLEGISIASVIISVDGPIEVTACVNGHYCDAEPSCALSGHWDMVNDVVMQALEGITLAEIATSRARARPTRSSLLMDAQPSLGQEIS